MEMMLQGTPPPIVVKIIEPKSDLQGLSDVLLGSLGLAGVFVLAAVALAALFAGVLFVIRMRSGGGQSEPPEDLRIV
jgi:hypothetical protein